MAQEIRVIPSSRRKLIYFCPECLQILKEFPKSRSLIDRLKKEVDSLKRELKVATDSIKSFKMDIKNQSDQHKSFENKMNELQKDSAMKEDIVQMQSEIEQLKQSSSTALSYADVVSDLNKETKTIKSNIDDLNNKINITATPANVGALQTSSAEVTLIEMQEREVRASNALIFGAKEASANNIEDRKSHDTEIVKDILNLVGVGLNGETIDKLKIIRVGKSEPNKQRPIKVIFPTKEDARKLLINKNKLNPDSGMYIKYDQTSMQRSYLKNLLQDLQKRTDNGETDLKIKYFNGTPKIVKFKKN